MADLEDLFIDGPVGKLSVRTKGLAAKPAEVVILVQGSNLTGQAMFDFNFPGGEDYSLMDAMVAHGFGAITFSIQGYGQSEPPADPFNVTTEAAMEDLAAVVAWATAQGFARPHLLAFSWGGRIAGRWAEDNAGKIGRLVLYDAARGGGGLVLPAPTKPWWANTREFYAEKLEPEFTDAKLRQALGDYVVSREPRSPNGIRRENAHPVTAIIPEKLTCPTLMIYGSEGAKAIYMQGGISRGEFFERLASDDKTYVILPNAGDFVHFQIARHRLHEEIGRFLKLRSPPTLAQA